MLVATLLQWEGCHNHDAADRLIEAQRFIPTCARVCTQRPVHRMQSDTKNLLTYVELLAAILSALARSKVPRVSPSSFASSSGLPGTTVLYKYESNVISAGSNKGGASVSERAGGETQQRNALCT